MNWFSFAAFAGLFWAAADILMRTFGDKSGSLWNTLFVIAGTFFTALISTFLLDRAHAPSLGTLLHFPSPFWGLIFAGVLNAVGYFFFFKLFAAGGNLTQGIPFMTIVLALGTVLGGIIFFHDAMSFRILLGIGTAVLSLYLLY